MSYPSSEMVFWKDMVQLFINCINITLFPLIHTYSSSEYHPSLSSQGLVFYAALAGEAVVLLAG